MELGVYICSDKIATMKTKPYGVRFDTELLDEMKKKQNIKTPQKVLNYLSDKWILENVLGISDMKIMMPESATFKDEKGNEVPLKQKEITQAENKPQIDKKEVSKAIVPKEGITPEIKQEPAKEVENQSDVFNFEGVAFFNIENYTKFPLSQKPKTQVEYDAWKSAKKKDDERIKKLYNEYKSKK